MTSSRDRPGPTRRPLWLCRTVAKRAGRAPAADMSHTDTGQHTRLRRKHRIDKTQEGLHEYVTYKANDIEWLTRMPWAIMRRGLPCICILY
jgi:hypothetical protein